MLSNLAKHGWSTNSMIQRYLDGILAPTAYWYVANASRKLRTSDATTATTDFDHYWMNILLPTKTYNDIYSGWSQNQRFRAVARLEYLRSRYCNTAVYNNAKCTSRACELRGRDQAFLDSKNGNDFVLQDLREVIYLEMKTPMRVVHGYPQNGLP